MIVGPSSAAMAGEPVSSARICNCRSAQRASGMAGPAWVLVGKENFHFAAQQFAHLVVGQLGDEQHLVRHPARAQTRADQFFQVSLGGLGVAFNIDVIVPALEQLQVPAGQYNAFKIEGVGWEVTSAKLDDVVLICATSALSIASDDGARVLTSISHKGFSRATSAVRYRAGRTGCGSTRRPASANPPSTTPAMRR